jgi:hypothetical protein
VKHHRLSLLALGTFLVGCRGIPPSPPDFPRQELEVLVEVDPEIPRLLRDDAERAVIEEVVSEAVFSLADVGLRFYPVAAASYQEDAERPEFYLTVRIRDLGAVLERQLVRPAREAAELGRAVASVQCAAAVTLYKRRLDGPPLIVGKAAGSGTADVREAAAQLSSMERFELVSESDYGPSKSFRSEDLTRCLRAAVNDAFGQLVEAIDRELTKESRPVVR